MKGEDTRPADPEILIRPLQTGDEKPLSRLAVRSFSPIEALGVAKPKEAVVATVGGELAGAVFLQVMGGRDGSKVGYLELAFVVKRFRRLGVGGRLYPAAIARLRQLGCGVLCAMVKDDNIASFGLLERAGFARAGYIDYLRAFGPGHGFLLWLRSFFFLASGMDFWFSRPATALKSGSEMLWFFLFNLVFLGLHALLFPGGNGLHRLTAGGLVLAAGVLAGTAGFFCAPAAVGALASAGAGCCFRRCCFCWVFSFLCWGAGTRSRRGRRGNTTGCWGCRPLSSGFCCWPLTCCCGFWSAMDRWPPP